MKPPETGDGLSARARARRAATRYRARDLPAASYRRLVKHLYARLHTDPNASPSRFAELSGIDARAAVYLADLQTPAVAIATAKLRWSRLGLPLTPDANPFVRAIADHQTGHCDVYRESALEKYYARWNPESIAELLGLSAEASPALGQPAAAVGLPWMVETADVAPADRLATVDRWAREESLRHGPELDGSHGHKLFGPVSDELGELEYSRYCGLAASIALNGYEESIVEPIGVQLLVGDTDWIGLATGPGLHRLAALAAIGTDPIPVAIDKRPSLVHRGDADAWPGVRSTLFTKAEALRLFDRILAGEPPDGLLGDTS